MVTWWISILDVGKFILVATIYFLILVNLGEISQEKFVSIHVEVLVSPAILVQAKQSHMPWSSTTNDNKVVRHGVEIPS